MIVWVVPESSVPRRTVAIAKERLTTLQKQFGLPPVDLKWFSRTEVPGSEAVAINDQSDNFPMWSRLVIERSSHGDLLGFTVYICDSIDYGGAQTCAEKEAKKLFRFVLARKREKDIAEYEERMATRKTDQ